MDERVNDLSQKIDNLQYQISRLTNLNTVQEKGKFPSQPHQNPKEHESESEAEKKNSEEIKGKRKWNSTKNEDLEATMNENRRGPSTKKK
ncbi:hypothetical protein CK203_037915 [Vitis vinifera]|uniref:Uncharacterized protein n=1 Tax=Vitis vinifera TaxID=29760 RepID=A0A438ICF4_VITVI|nr:hypothetical protein CK203_037915 [Vitis vinifera]